MTHPMPGVNHLVRVRVGDDVNAHRSRVEDVAPAALLIAAPSYAGDLLTTRVGMPLSVQWTGPRGVFEVDGELAEVLRRGAVTLWSVRVTSPVRVVQRRRYARARCEVPMTFQSCDPPAEEVTGTGVDLSEGGLRARVPAGTLAETARVQARFVLDGQAVTVVGSVIKLVPQPRAPEIVVIFEQPVDDDAVIRRWVLQQQILARRKVVV